MIKSPTRVVQESSTIIDIIASSKESDIKDKYDEKLLVENNLDPNSFWSTIKKIISKNWILTVIQTKKKKLKLFADCFSSVAEKLKSKAKITTPRTEEHFEFLVFQMLVLKQMKKLKPKKISLQHHWKIVPM